MTRVWLDVPYTDKDEAKRLGAEWDGRERRWYAPRPGLPALARWAARPDVPALLPGEDRSFGAGLYVDMIASTCWFTNVRSCVDPADWERLRRMIVGRAGSRCEACGRGEERANRCWLEAHERWHYDGAARVQQLRRLICLCTPCHQATHLGLAGIKGAEQAALAHLRSVTGMSPAGLRRHVDEAFALWQQRSRHTWHLDLRMLTSAGIALAPPPQAAARPAIARDRLTAAQPPDLRGSVGTASPDLWLPPRPI